MGYVYVSDIYIYIYIYNPDSRLRETGLKTQTYGDRWETNILYNV